jgi:hypothetical protein
MIRCQFEWFVSRPWWQYPPALAKFTGIIRPAYNMPAFHAKQQEELAKAAAAGSAGRADNGADADADYVAPAGPDAPTMVTTPPVYWAPRPPVMGTQPPIMGTKPPIIGTSPPYDGHMTPL